MRNHLPVRHITGTETFGWILMKRRASFNVLCLLGGMLVGPQSVAAEWIVCTAGHYQPEPLAYFGVSNEAFDASLATDWRMQLDAARPFDPPMIKLGLAQPQLAKVICSDPLDDQALGNYKRNHEITVNKILRIDGARLGSIAWRPSRSTARSPASVPSALSPVSQRGKPVSSIAASYEAPNGALVPLPLGQKIQVTPTMVIQQSDDYFKSYYYTIILRGNPGDRIRIAWQGTVPLAHAFAESGYEVDWPEGQTLSAPGGSLTVTLRKLTDHTIDFSQAGKEARTGARRGFLPFWITVTKL